MGICEICEKRKLDPAHGPAIVPACMDCRQRPIYHAAVIGRRLLNEAGKNPHLITALSPDGRTVYWATLRGLNAASTQGCLMDDLVGAGFHATEAGHLSLDEAQQLSQGCTEPGSQDHSPDDVGGWKMPPAPLEYDMGG